MSSVPHIVRLPPTGRSFDTAHADAGIGWLTAWRGSPDSVSPEERQTARGTTPSRGGGPTATDLVVESPRERKRRPDTDAAASRWPAGAAVAAAAVDTPAGPEKTLAGPRKQQS